MKILVACELPSFALAELRSLSSELRHEPGLRSEQLCEAIVDIGVLVVDSRRVSPQVISAGKALQMIVHAGQGPGDIAFVEASTHGIFVSHCPSQHAAAVAELAFGLMLSLDRRIVDNTIALRDGRWTRGEFKHAQGLAGRTLGILGYGVVGQELARRAHAFDMKVVAWSPTRQADLESSPTPPSPSDYGIIFCARPRELARQSDYVVCCDAADESDHMASVQRRQESIVNAEFLESMPIGAHLVHVGHSGALDDAAVIEAIQARNLRFALDVFPTEPAGDVGRFRCKFCTFPGVIGTQHIGAITEQARQATATEIVRIIRSFLVSGEIVNCINLQRSPATWQLVLRIRDAVGVLASILDTIRTDGINAEEVTSRVFLGAQAAWCAISLNERPSTEALNAIRALDKVLYLEVRAVV